MTDLSHIPAHILARAAADPANAHARSLLLRAAGSHGEGVGTPEVREVAQEDKERSAGAGKRRGERNQLEQRFAEEVLNPMILSGELDRYEYEGLTFYVHDTRSRCCPDFIGWKDGVPVPFEVKSDRFVHEATVLRMKVHAAARPWLRWRIYARKDGAWVLRYDSGERRS